MQPVSFGVNRRVRNNVGNTPKDTERGGDVEPTGTDLESVVIGSEPSSSAATAFAWVLWVILVVAVVLGWIGLSIDKSCIDNSEGVGEKTGCSDCGVNLRRKGKITQK